MKRVLSVLTVALLMAAMMSATAMPAFAAKPDLIGSAVSPQNFEEEEGEGPHNGLNYGHCTKDRESEIAPGNGRSTAAWNPSFHGLSEELSGGSFTCGKI